MASLKPRTESFGMALFPLGWLCVFSPFLDPTLTAQYCQFELFLAALLMWLTGMVSAIDSLQSPRGKLVMALNGLSLLFAIAFVVWALHLMAEAG